MSPLSIARFALLAAIVFAAPAAAQPSDRTTSSKPATTTPFATTRVAAKPSIVLVHGAFADASGWDAVIRILQGKGYEVTAVQNPLNAYASDIETTKRVLDAQTGPTVAVGHSYGGAVITAAAAGNTNVKALVYVAAFANDANEPIGAFIQKYPSLLGKALRPDAAGFVTIDRAQFHEVFAQDLPPAQSAVMAATQKPVIGSGFAASTPVAAWRTTPSWYVVAQNDNVINPDLSRFYATRMKATTTEIKASHVVFISHAREVAAVIEAAAAVAARP